jgi:hypothetical protein
MARPEISNFSSMEELQAAPIAADWIVDGTPLARNRVLAPGTDRSSWTMLWDCTAGTFDWHYSFDETVHVIEGGVTVTDANGVSRTLKAGDMAFFPAGVSARWHVDHYIRKVAFCQQPAPAILSLMPRIARKIARQFDSAAGLIARSLKNPAAPAALPAPASTAAPADSAADALLGSGSQGV